MSYWPSDPAEQLVALAALTHTLAEDDPRMQTILGTFEAAFRALPEYQPEVDLHKMQQGPALRYLDPSARARFEAALLIPAEKDTFGLLPNDESFWYLNRVQKAEMVVRGLLNGDFSGLAPDDLEQQMDRLSHDYAGFDGQLKDLLEMAASYALALNDVERGRARATRIGAPSIQNLANLLILTAEDSGASLPQRILDSLAAMGDAISPLHRATLAAEGAHLCQSLEHDSDAIFEWGLKQLEGADPLYKARGRLALTPFGPAGRQGSLLSEALGATEAIQNEYLRNDVVADLFGAAIALSDAPLVSRMVARLVEARWSVFMDALRRAMPHIVNVAGPGIVENMDSSMRRAQNMLAGDTSPSDGGHLDGVLEPSAREQAWKTASENADRSLEAYLATYLDQTDVGPTLRHVQDSRIQPADPDDDIFARLGGRRTGLSVWLANFDQPVWRMVDIRFLFADANQAAEYHHERLTANSEGHPAVAQFSAVGQECHVFGGTDTVSAPGGANMPLTCYFYVFRVGRVVVKLFVAQGPQTGKQLTPDHLVPFARRIVEKIVAAGLGEEAASG